MASIRFYAETGNQTIIEGYARIIQGWNEMDEHVIRQNAIDTLPYVRMPKDWDAGAPQFHTTAPSPLVQAGEAKPEQFTYHGEARKEPSTTLEKKAKEIKDRAGENQWSPMRVMAMDYKRAQKVIAEQKDVAKLVELLQFAKSKPEYRKAVIARIKQLDPDNPFAASAKQEEEPPPEESPKPDAEAPKAAPPKAVDQE